MNVDLHSHSIASDGLLTSEDVAARAHAGGVQAWALTDHDEVKGLAAARAAAEALGMRFIDGVEISVTWRPDEKHKGTTIHVVGLQIDPANPVLLEGLKKIRAGRDERAEKMARDLEIAGISGALEGAKKYAVNPELLSRSHFARFLVEAGKARNTHHAFGHYLTEGKPGYVAHQWATLPEALAWIHAAGGVPVVAHPGRYKLGSGQLDQFFREFKDLGGNAIEVMTGSHTPEQYNHFAEVARCYGFRASRGSDYHGPGESRVDPGQLPPLPADLTPVWHDWF
jgi:predicted metal-dependent phosphoesterase TrpH